MKDPYLAICNALLSTLTDDSGQHMGLRRTEQAHLSSHMVVAATTPRTALL